MYSAIYVASYYKKYFWINVLYKKHSLKLHTHTVLQKYVMNLNNCVLNG